MIPSAVSENDRTNVLASGTVFRSQRLLPSGDRRSPGRRADRSTTPSLTWRVGGGVAGSAAKAAPARFTAAKAQSNDLIVLMRTSLPQTGRVPPIRHLPGESQRAPIRRAAPLRVARGPERLGEGQLVRRMAWAPHDGRARVLQAEFRIARPGRPSRGPKLQK